MEIKNETVTLSLQTYEEMKKEIKALKEKKKKKTIVKYYHHPVYGHVALAVIYFLFFYFTLKM